MKGKGKIFILKSSMTRDEKEKVVHEFIESKTSDAKSTDYSGILDFVGKVKIDVDPIEYQKNIRGEWERRTSL